MSQQSYGTLAIEALSLTEHPKVVVLDGKPGAPPNFALRLGGATFIGTAEQWAGIDAAMRAGMAAALGSAVSA